jgi:hypothetical protein
LRPCGFSATKEHVRFDLGEGDITSEQYCVVVGQRVRKLRYADKGLTNPEYHILVVVSTGVDGEYRRVGAGTVLCSHVMSQRLGVRIV